jgi:hypothetical protein
VIRGNEIRDMCDFEISSGKCGTGKKDTGKCKTGIYETVK